MGWFKSLLSGFSGTGKAEARDQGNDSHLSEQEIATIIASHAHSRRIPLLADLPPGETDVFSYYLKRLKGSPADEFEARLLVWIGSELHVIPVFNQGTNAGYWTFSYRGESVALSVIGAGKNTMSKQLDSSIPWRLRIEQALPASFIERMKLEFTPDNPVIRQLGSDAIRVQFNVAGLRPDSALSRTLAPAPSH
jgi:hypothetical protein